MIMRVAIFRMGEFTGVGRLVMHNPLLPLLYSIPFFPRNRGIRGR